MDLHSLHVYTSHRCSTWRADYSAHYKPQRYYFPVDYWCPPLREHCLIALESTPCLHTLIEDPEEGGGMGRKIKAQESLSLAALLALNQSEVGRGF